MKTTENTPFNLTQELAKEKTTPKKRKEIERQLDEIKINLDLGYTLKAIYDVLKKNQIVNGSYPYFTIVMAELLSPAPQKDSASPQDEPLRVKPIEQPGFKVPPRTDDAPRGLQYSNEDYDTKKKRLLGE